MLRWKVMEINRSNNDRTLNPVAGYVMRLLKMTQSDCSTFANGSFQRILWVQNRSYWPRRFEASMPEPLNTVLGMTKYVPFCCCYGDLWNEQLFVRDFSRLVIFRIRKKSVKMPRHAPPMGFKIFCDDWFFFFWLMENAGQAPIWKTIELLRYFVMGPSPLHGICYFDSIHSLTIFCE